MLVAALGIMASAGFADEAARPVQPSWRHPAGNAARGEELAHVCLTCHVTNSPQVDPPAPKLHRQRQSYLFRALLAYRDGTRQSDVMAPFAQGLSDQDARDLAAFLAGEMLDQPPRARTYLPAYNRTARDCIWCHGETGIGEFESMPVLTGQEAEYLARALAEYRDGRRMDPTMQDVAKALDPQAFAELAEYYAAHEWLEHPR